MYTHSTAPRAASGDPFLVASAFKANQVEWFGGKDLIDSVEHKEYMPPNSSNPHYFCSCEKRQYLGVDACRLLGVIALNLKRVEGYKDNSIPATYRPNHHLFYADRVVDVPDGLPKWKTVLEGEIIPETSNTDSNKPLSIAHPHDMILSSNAPLVSNRPIEWIEGSGRVRKDVLPLSPVRPAEPHIYHFPETEFPANNRTIIPEDKIQERVDHKYYKSPNEYIPPIKTGKRGSIIIGGGHNGLVAAAYLARKGIDTLVLERRHVIGGAAVTEEIIPGFKFSRASYLAGLLRPQIISDLELDKYGFKYLPRNPSSFTPTLSTSPYFGKYLILGENEKENYESIAQFSRHDAEAYPLYEEFLGKVRDVIQPLLDNPLPSNPLDAQSSLAEKVLEVIIIVTYYK